MAAPLISFTGPAIYLDTMLPYMLLRGIDQTVATFFERIEGGDMVAYTSALTFDELAYRLLLAFIKDQYGVSPLDRLRSEEERMLAEFASPVAALLRRLHAFPHLVVLDVYASDIEAMNQAMSQYHLRPRDALHFVAMERTGCFDLASTDPHFDRLPQVRRYAF